MQVGATLASGPLPTPHDAGPQSPETNHESHFLESSAILGFRHSPRRMPPSAGGGTPPSLPIFPPCSGITEGAARVAQRSETTGGPHRTRRWRPPPRCPCAACLRHVATEPQRPDGWSGGRRKRRPAHPPPFHPSSASVPRSGIRRATGSAHSTPETSSAPVTSTSARDSARPEIASAESAAAPVMRRSPCTRMSASSPVVSISEA